jgi:hypothetical protein
MFGNPNALVISGKGAIMKTILTRTLMVALLATSISAFAQNSDGKSGDAATATNVAQQNDCNRKANDATTQDEQQSSAAQQIEEQDNAWQHDLQGIYGG